jgi:precorrin-6B methylase 1
MQPTPETASAVAPPPSSVEVAIVRLEGKIDRLVDGLQRHGEDMKVIRERQHEHANQITALSTLNLPEKLTVIAAELKDHDHRLSTCESDMDQRKGAANLAKAVWAVATLLGLTGILAIVRFFFVGHP